MATSTFMGKFNICLEYFLFEPLDIFVLGNNQEKKKRGKRSPPPLKSELTRIYIWLEIRASIFEREKSRIDSLPIPK